MPEEQSDITENEAAGFSLSAEPPSLEEEKEEELEPLTDEEEEEKTPTQRAIDSLRAEGYEDEDITNFAIDLRAGSEIAEFYLDALDRIEERREEVGDKARFFLHREKNGDLYLLKSPQLKSEGKSAWVQLMHSPEELVGARPEQAQDEDQRQLIVQAIDQAERRQERYREELLREVMIYPRYDEVDWDYTGGMHAPGWLTVSRLLNTFWKCELPDPSVPQSTTFDGGEVSRSKDIAETSVSDRPGL